MKRILSVLLTLAVILAMIPVPALAEPPIAALGDWDYMPTVVSMRVADGNTIYQTTEVGMWTGTFDGESREAGYVTVMASGLVTFRATVSFLEVEVQGKSGTLEMRVAGTKSDALSDWQGKWAIVSGTGDLATLRGQGTWWGPGYDPTDPTEWGEIHYAGRIHFEP